MPSLSNGESQPLLVNQNNNVHDPEYQSTSSMPQMEEASSDLENQSTPSTPQSEQASPARHPNGFFTIRESRTPSCDVSVGLLILGLLTKWISPFSSDEMNNIVGGGLLVAAAVFACMSCCSETRDQEIEVSFRRP